MGAAAGDPCELDVREAARELAARRLSACELVAACLERIERDRARSARVDAFVRVYPERAMASARRADAARARAAGERPRPLLGVPLGVKDVFALAGVPVTAGSELLRDAPRSPRDAAACAALERAGMIAVGHTRTWEFAFGAPPELVGNPWDPSRSASGSSAGSAAAVAGGYVPAALGTDTGGSLRGPAAYCGASTIKPTRGRVPLSGAIPCAVSFDHVGPIARTVRDCGLLLEALAPGEWGQRGVGELAARAGAAPLRGVKLVCSPRTRDPALGVADEVRAGVVAAKLALIELGARLVWLLPPEFDHSGFWPLVEADALAYHRGTGDWPARRDRYTARLRDLLERAEAANLDVTGRARWEQVRRRITESWWSWFRAHRVDVLIEPTMPEAAPVRAIAGAPPPAAGGNLTSFWNHVGFPVVTLPAGVGDRSGLPVSISLVGPPGSDRRLLQIAVDLQARLGVPSPSARAVVDTRASAA